MTNPTNEDFSNCELSIEELDAIAGGWPGWVHSIVHGVESVAGGVWGALMSPVGKAATSALFFVAGAIMMGPVIASTNRK